MAQDLTRGGFPLKNRFMFYTQMDSPIGNLVLTSDGTALTGIFHPHQKRYAKILENSKQQSALFADALAQLQEYFAGTRKTFTLSLSPHGTAFQHKVWEALCKIPYGETTSYIGIAKSLGKPTASRAVGMANGKNPLPFIVPCHRVIGSNGKLTGYAGGLEMKQWLLTHETKYK